MPEAPSGNRNLALNTSAGWNSGWTSFNGQNNQTVVIYRIYNRGLKVGDKVNVRLVLKYSDIVAADGQTAKIIPQTEGNVTHYGLGRLDVGQYVYLSSEDDEVVLTGVTTITETHLRNEYWNWRLRVDYVASGKIQWKEAKAEISESATPYSQAPEDLGWSIITLVPTQEQRYLWKFEYIYYSDGSVEVTKPVNLSIAGADADTSGVTDAINKNNQAVSEAKQQLTTVANDLSQAKQDLTSQAQQLQAQASAQSELTKRVSSVEKTADGTKTTVSELSKTVAQNGKDITSVTARTKVVEDDLSGTKTTLSQVKTTADSTSQKTATLETGLNGVKADLTATTTTANTTKTNLANYQASNDKAVANLQSNLQTANGNISSLQTKVEAVPGQITSAVSAVEGKIPTEIGGRNLYALSKNAGIYTKDITDFVQNVETGEISFKVIGRDPFFGTAIGASRGVKIPVKKGEDIAVQLTNELFAKNFVSYLGSDDIAVKNFKNYQTNKFIIPASELEGVSYVTFRFGLVEETQAVGSTHSTKIKVEYGNVYTDWTPAPEDTVSQINSLSSEFKQTTDSIKASVSSLDKSTIKSSSLTINSDGIVMKAGKSTTDVANAIGSYFAVNQNAINLFSDKINVKGSMIVDGAITGDKIKANSVDVSKIVGIDADYIKAKIEYAMIDWLKGKTITAYNDNMTIDLQDGRISFKDGSNAVYRQTPDGIHTGFLHFEAGSQGGIYAAFGATSTRQGINSKSSEFAGIRCYRVSADGDSHDAKVDKIEVIGDAIQFGHGYRSDGQIGGGFIMDTAVFGDETPYSLNRVIKSIEALWRILHDHAKNTGYRFDDSAFISALNNEYNAWHDMHND